MIHLDGVSKTFGGRTALQPTSLAVPAGEVHALVGASGSGKSTLLRLIVGLLAPDTGTVRIGNETLTRESRRRLRHGLGYVIQDGGLFPHLTARENVSILACDLGWDRERVSARVDRLREAVRLPSEAIDRYPAQLSGGQRQRIGVMRALMLDPPVLLLDEPLGALDPITRAELQEELKALFAELGKTVVLVTHDMAEAAFLAHRISVLRDGRVLQTAPFAELLSTPADPYVTRFLSAERLLPGEGN